MSFFWRDSNDTNSWSSKMVGELEDCPNHGLRCLSRLCLNMMCWIRNTTTMSWAMPLDHRSPVVLQLRMFGWLQKPWQNMASSWQMLPQNCWDPWEPRSHAVAEVAKALELSNFMKQKSTKMTTWQCFTRHLWSAPTKSFLDSRLDPQTISVQNTFVWLYMTCPFSSWSLSSIFWTSSITASNIQRFAVRRGSFGLGYSRSRSGRCGSVAGRLRRIGFSYLEGISDQLNACQASQPVLVSGPVLNLQLVGLGQTSTYIQRPNVIEDPLSSPLRWYWITLKIIYAVWRCYHPFFAEIYSSWLLPPGWNLQPMLWWNICCRMPWMKSRSGGGGASCWGWMGRWGCHVEIDRKRRILKKILVFQTFLMSHHSLRYISSCIHVSMSPLVS